MIERPHTPPCPAATDHRYAVHADWHGAGWTIVDRQDGGRVVAHFPPEPGFDACAALRRFRREAAQATRLVACK